MDFKTKYVSKQVLRELLEQPLICGFIVRSSTESNKTEIRVSSKESVLLAINGATEENVKVSIEDADIPRAFFVWAITPQ